jgi:hypothetical protein
MSYSRKYKLDDYTVYVTEKKEIHCGQRSRDTRGNNAKRCILYKFQKFADKDREIRGATMPNVSLL